MRVIGPRNLALPLAILFAFLFFLKFRDEGAIDKSEILPLEIQIEDKELSSGQEHPRKEDTETEQPGDVIRDDGRELVIYLAVVVVCHKLDQVTHSRDGWNNNQYWREHGANISIYHVVGSGVDISSLAPTPDIIQTSLPESRSNLKLKIQEGMAHISDLISFEYIFKTDADVINDYCRWEGRIRDLAGRAEGPLKYSGIFCSEHFGVKYRWCSGFAYLLHNSVVGLFLDYPADRMEIPEDKTVGKVMYDNGMEVKRGSVIFSDNTVKLPIGWRDMLTYKCTGDMRDIISKVGGVHFNILKGRPKKIRECWNKHMLDDNS